MACFRLEQIGVAAERARLPHLIGEPFALANGDGTVHSVSDEAAAWGVCPGQSVAGARSLCLGLIVLPYDRPAYEAAVRPIWDAIATESSAIEPISPETSFAQVEGREDTPARVRCLAALIAERVGIPVRVGLARTKFAAYRAAEGDREGQTVNVPIGDEAAFLSGLPLSQAPGLDPKARQQLERLGVKTLGDLLAVAPHRLPKSLRRAGHHLFQLLHGYDGDPVRPLWPPRALTEHLDCEEGINDRFLVERALLSLAERVACGLAPRREFCRELTLRVGLQDGSHLTESERLALPLSQVPPLFRAAVRLLLRLPTLDQPIASLGLVAGDLGSGSGAQLSLLDLGGPLPNERAARLEATLAYLRRRFGGRSVVTGKLLEQARRIGLWTFPLTHLLSDPATVATDHRGSPVRYWRTQRRRRQPRRYEVRRVQNRWRETGWQGDRLTDTEVWRVETDPWGLSELHRLEAGEWRVCGTQD